jgi:hypothetical protein
MANAGMSHSLLIRRRVTETNMAAFSCRMTSGKFEIAAVCALCGLVISSVQLERRGRCWQVARRECASVASFGRDA